MIIQLKKKTEWIETAGDALSKLKSDRNTFSLRSVSPLLDNLINTDANGLLFYTVSRNEIKKEDKTIKVPEQMNLLFSSFFVSDEKAELLTVDQIYFSPNFIDEIGNKKMLGMITAARILGTDLNNRSVETEGIIFNPGWSIPLNLNNLKGKDLLITVGKFNFILFYDAKDGSIVISELL
jgi:hypothetical protein